MPQPPGGRDQVLGNGAGVRASERVKGLRPEELQRLGRGGGGDRTHKERSSPASPAAHTPATGVSRAALGKPASSSSLSLLTCASAGTRQPAGRAAKPRVTPRKHLPGAQARGARGHSSLSGHSSVRTSVEPCPTRSGSKASAPPPSRALGLGEELASRLPPDWRHEKGLAARSAGREDIQPRPCWTSASRVGYRHRPGHLAEGTVPGPGADFDSNRREPPRASPSDQGQG